MTPLFFRKKGTLYVLRSFAGLRGLGRSSAQPTRLSREGSTSRILATAPASAVAPGFRPQRTNLVLTDPSFKMSFTVR